MKEETNKGKYRLQSWASQKSYFSLNAIAIAIAILPALSFHFPQCAKIRLSRSPFVGPLCFHGAAASCSAARRAASSTATVFHIACSWSAPIAFSSHKLGKPLLRFVALKCWNWFCVNLGAWCWVVFMGWSQVWLEYAFYIHLLRFSIWSRWVLSLLVLQVWRGIYELLRMLRLMI